MNWLTLKPMNNIDVEHITDLEIIKFIQKFNSKPNSTTKYVVKESRKNQIYLFKLGFLGCLSKIILLNDSSLKIPYILSDG